MSGRKVWQRQKITVYDVMPNNTNESMKYDVMPDNTNESMKYD